MQFVIRAYDGEGMLERRLAVRPRHLAGIDRLADHVVCAGGLLDDAGTMVGSMLVLDLPDRVALERYLAEEPYLTEGVWESVEVESMNVVIVNGDKVGA